jgi:hypothetical protein
MGHNWSAGAAHGFGGTKDSALAGHALRAIICRLWCCENNKTIDDNIDGIRWISDSEDEFSVV